jgi:hypothetical protein
MKIKQWMEKTKDREQWRLVVEEAKAYQWLYRREDGWMDLRQCTSYNFSCKVSFLYTSWMAEKNRKLP